MADPGTSRERSPRAHGHRGPAGAIDAAAWGAFLIWLGAAWLARLPVGVLLLGFATIVVAAQLARRARGMGLEWPWLFVAACSALAGIWSLAAIQLELVPVLLIVAGAALLLSLLGRARHYA